MKGGREMYRNRGHVFCVYREWPVAVNSSTHRDDVPYSNISYFLYYCHIPTVFRQLLKTQTTATSKYLHSDTTQPALICTLQTRRIVLEKTSTYPHITNSRNCTNWGSKEAPSRRCQQMSSRTRSTADSAGMRS